MGTAPAQVVLTAVTFSIVDDANDPDSVHVVGILNWVICVDPVFEGPRQI
jgi:hypothetical protein